VIEGHRHMLKGLRVRIARPAATIRGLAHAANVARLLAPKLATRVAGQVVAGGIPMLRITT